MTPRKKQSQITKQNILIAAVQLFSEEPFEKVTVQRICKEANVTTGAFYHHFPSKEHILKLKYDMVDQLFADALGELISETYPEKICEYLWKYAKTAEDDGVNTVTEVYRMWLGVKEDFPFNYTQGFIGGLFKLIELGIMEEQLKKDINVQVLVRDLAILTRGVIYYWCQRRGSFDLKEKVVHQASIFLSAYKTK